MKMKHKLFFTLILSNLFLFTFSSCSCEPKKVEVKNPTGKQKSVAPGLIPERIIEFNDAKAMILAYNPHTQDSSTILNVKYVNFNTYEIDSLFYSLYGRNIPDTAKLTVHFANYVDNQRIRTLLRGNATRYVGRNTMVLQVTGNPVMDNSTQFDPDNPQVYLNLGDLHPPGVGK